MKHKHSLFTAFITIISISLPVFSVANSTSVNAESSVTISKKSTAADATVLVSGNFEKSEHPTSGTAKIVVKNGKKQLKFDSDFKSDNGPDLFVLLHRQDSPKNYDKASYLNLGRLKKVSGQQMYLIPQGVDVAKFKSVVIWCRKFNATFGFAPLN